MRWFFGLLMTCIITVNVVLLLSYLPVINTKKDVPTIRDVSILQNKLDQYNLVDHLVQLPLQLDMIKVDWKNSILSIDLTISNPRVNAIHINEDLIEISHFGLSTMKNVNEVLVRVFYNQTADLSHPNFVVALNAERGQWSNIRYQQMLDNELSEEQFLKSFTLIYSKSWEKWTNDTKTSYMDSR